MLACLECRHRELIRGVRAAHHFDDGIHLGIVENDIVIVHDAIGKRAVGKIAQIENISNVDAAARSKTDAVLIFGNDLGRAASNDTKAKQSNLERVLRHEKILRRKQIYNSISYFRVTCKHFS